MAIIDLLEVIQIQYGQRAELANPPRAHLLHETAPVQQTCQGVMAGLLTQGQGPVLGAEQQHPEGGEVTAHQHGEKGQHVDPALIHQHPGIPFQQEAHPHQVEAIEQDIDHGEHQHSRQVGGIAVSPDEKDDHGPQYHVAQTGQQYPGRHMVVEQDAPAQDQHIDQHEQRACPPAERLAEETLQCQRHQGDTDGDQQIGQPDPGQIGHESLQGEETLGRQGAQARPPPESESGDLPVGQPYDGEGDKTEAVATQGHDHEGEYIQLEQY